MYSGRGVVFLAAQKTTFYFCMICMINVTDTVGCLQRKPVEEILNGINADTRWIVNQDATFTTSIKIRLDN